MSQKLRAFLLISVICLVNMTTAFSQTYMVTTIAGNGTAGLVDSIGTYAECNTPYELCSDGANTIYFCDTYNHVIRKYDKITSRVTTIAGTGVVGFQDGAAASAKFNYPEGIVVKNNILYIGDNYNHRIRKIDLNTNIVSTVAGTGTAGHLDGAALSAQFHNPKFLTLDKNGDLYISDYVNNCVRKLSGGQVSTVAGVPGVQGYVNGPGSSAKFTGISDLCIDTLTGNIYLTDNNNSVIRKIDASYNVTTYCGSGVSGHADGSSTTAQFMFPSSLDLTKHKVMYVTGGSGGDNSIRKIDSLGNVTTVAGTVGGGYQDGLASVARFNQPYGVCYDNYCAIYIADSFNHRLRKMSIPEGPAGCSTGIFEGQKQSAAVIIYPNPGNGVFTLEFPSEEFYKYEITNSVGMVVASGVMNVTSSQINLTPFANGIYFIKMSNGTHMVTNKLIIQK